MKVDLAYGHGHLQLDLPDARTTVIAPSHNPGLPDEKAAVMRCRKRRAATTEYEGRA